MSSDYDKLMRAINPTSWSKWLVNWVATLGFLSLSVILNVSVGLVLGGLIGWLFGGWISTGLALFDIQIPAGEIYKLTAPVGLLTGFVATMCKFALLIKITKD